MSDLTVKQANQMYQTAGTLSSSVMGAVEHMLVCDDDHMIEEFTPDEMRERVAKGDVPMPETDATMVNAFLMWEKASREIGMLVRTMLQDEGWLAPDEVEVE